MIWPEAVTNIIAVAVGIILIAIGGIYVISKLVNQENKFTGMLVGFIVLILGVWILVHPTSAASIIPIVIGVVLVASGVQELRLSFAAKNVDAAKWGWMIVGSVVTIIFGIICICMAFAILKTAMRLLGLFLIYDGVSSMVMVRHVNVAERVVDSVVTKEEDVDDFF